MIEQILPFHKEQILRIKPSSLRVPDELAWLKNPSGEYSTRSGYRSLKDESPRTAPLDATASTDWIASVWNIKTSEKIKIFFWKSLHGALPGALPVGEQFAIQNMYVSSL